MVSIGPYDLCLSTRVAKAWRQKEINPFLSEVTESTCIIIIIDITMTIQWLQIYLILMQEPFKGISYQYKIRDCVLRTSIDQKMLEAVDIQQKL